MFDLRTYYEHMLAFQSTFEESSDKLGALQRFERIVVTEIPMAAYSECAARACAAYAIALSGGSASEDGVMWRFFFRTVADLIESSAVDAESAPQLSSMLAENMDLVSVSVSVQFEAESTPILDALSV